MALSILTTPMRVEPTWLVWVSGAAYLLRLVALYFEEGAAERGPEVECFFVSEDD